MNALSHRTKLGMGIESKYRSQGYGRLLMETAVTWAKSQGNLRGLTFGTGCGK